MDLMREGKKRQIKKIMSILQADNTQTELLGKQLDHSQNPATYLSPV